MGYNSEVDIDDYLTATKIRRHLDLGLPLKEDFTEEGDKVAFAHVNGHLSRAEYLKYLRACDRLSPLQDPFGYIADQFRGAWIGARTVFDYCQLAAIRTAYNAFGWEAPRVLSSQEHPTEIMRVYRNRKKKAGGN